jgi:hypothetical protein
MLRTICLGSCVLIQGAFVSTFADGSIAVRIGDRIFRGKPVPSERAA